MTVERALQLKELPYRRVEHIPVAHKLTVRAHAGAGTVPALVFPDGRRLAGSRAILRALEAHPPSLLPADPERRRVVERAEEWGDQVLQPLVRRVTWAALRRRPSAVMPYSASARLPVPRPLARASAPLIARAARAVNDGSDPNVRADLAHLGHHFDRIDRWIADGVLGGEEPTTGDLQLGPSIALLASVEDLAGILGDRPALTLARRWFPAYPEGSVPAGTLPPEWLSDEVSSASWAPWATGPSAGSSAG